MPSLGETFRATATLLDINGSPLVAPDSQTVKLNKPDGTTHTTSIAPVDDGGGVFHQDFTILATDPVGVWMIVWTATKTGIVGVQKKPVFIDDP